MSMYCHGCGKVIEEDTDTRCHECKSNPRRFPVTDGEKEGTCQSFYDHFDVYWNDGTSQRGIMDLSYCGIRKLEGASESDE